MMDEILPVITAAVCVIAPMLTAILLVRRRMRRGEIVQVTVRRVDLDDAAPPTSHFCHPHLRLSLAGADPGDLPAAPPGNFAAPGGGAAGDALGPHQPPPAGTALRPLLGHAHSDLRLCTLRADGGRRLCGCPPSVCAPAWYVLTSAWGLSAFWPPYSG